MAEVSPKQLRQGIQNAFDKIAQDCPIGEPLVMLPARQAYVIEGERILVDANALRTVLVGLMGD